MISPAQLARQRKLAKRLLLAFLMFIAAMTIVTIVFGPELTWRAVIFAGALTFFVGSSQLALERDRRRRDEYLRVRGRANRTDKLAADGTHIAPLYVVDKLTPDVEVQEALDLGRPVFIYDEKIGRYRKAEIASGELDSYLGTG